MSSTVPAKLPAKPTAIPTCSSTASRSDQSRPGPTNPSQQSATYQNPFSLIAPCRSPIRRTHENVRGEPVPKHRRHRSGRAPHRTAGAASPKQPGSTRRRTCRPGSSKDRVTRDCPKVDHARRGDPCVGPAPSKIGQGTAPALVARHAVGPDTAGALLVAAGDNPERLRNDASFASLCGASPVEASSGRTNRHRLNRGGNREANSALWRIVLVLLSMNSEKRTKRYVERRTIEGLSKIEIHALPETLRRTRGLPRPTRHRRSGLATPVRRTQPFTPTENKTLDRRSFPDVRKRAAFSDSALGSTYQGLASHKRTYLRQPVRCGPAASNRVSDVVRENNVSEQPCSIRHHQRRMRCTHPHTTQPPYIYETLPLFVSSDFSTNARIRPVLCSLTSTRPRSASSEYGPSRSLAATSQGRFASPRLQPV